MTDQLKPKALDADVLWQFVNNKWDADILPALTDYITVPAKSPDFDPDWEANGYIEQVICAAADWVKSQDVDGMTVEILRLPGRTPVLYFDAPATRDDNGDAILMYGHLDKQPEFSGWKEGLGPWTPVYRDDKLYGRGGADDGYAVYASLTAMLALDKQGIPRPRCIGLIETCEESGSYDLLPYIDSLRERMGNIALVVCLDSGAGNYEQLWMTTSLRGMVTGRLTVKIIDEGVHSGDASGVVPDSFRIARHLLERLEDSETGRILPDVFHCDIPAERIAQAKQAADALGDSTWCKFPWSRHDNDDSVHPMATGYEALLQRTWRPILTVTGADGLPVLAKAGNVLRPFTTLKLSLRLLPLVDAKLAAAALKELLETDAPLNAVVSFTPDNGIANGWNAPIQASWLTQALDEASRQYYDGLDCGYIGQGGSIPLMNTLRAGFPNSQFMICGVLGPNSNAHGPNEFLHVPFGKKLTAAVSQTIASIPTGL